MAFRIRNAEGNELEVEEHMFAEVYGPQGYERVPASEAYAAIRRWAEMNPTSAEPRVELGEGSAMTVLESVRTARNDGYDRIVFEFEEGRSPGFRVEFVELPVRQCGSGQPVPLRGDTWLRVRLEPSQAHDDRGRATVRDRGGGFNNTRNSDFSPFGDVGSAKTRSWMFVNMRVIASACKRAWNNPGFALKFGN